MSPLLIDGASLVVLPQESVHVGKALEVLEDSLGAYRSGQKMVDLSVPCLLQGKWCQHGQGICRAHKMQGS